MTLHDTGIVFLNKYHYDKLLEGTTLRIQLVNILTSLKVLITND